MVAGDGRIGNGKGLIVGRGTRSTDRRTSGDVRETKQRGDAAVTGHGLSVRRLAVLAEISPGDGMAQRAVLPWAGGTVDDRSPTDTRILEDTRHRSLTPRAEGRGRFRVRELVGRRFWRARWGKTRRAVEQYAAAAEIRLARPTAEAAKAARFDEPLGQNVQRPAAGGLDAGQRFVFRQRFLLSRPAGERQRLVKPLGADRLSLSAPHPHGFLSPYVYGVRFRRGWRTTICARCAQNVRANAAQMRKNAGRAERPAFSYTFRKPLKRRRFQSSRSGTRTRTSLTGQRILNPLRLPFRHPASRVGFDPGCVAVGSLWFQGRRAARFVHHLRDTTVEPFVRTRETVFYGRRVALTLTRVLTCRRRHLTAAVHGPAPVPAPMQASLDATRPRCTSLADPCTHEKRSCRRADACGAASR